MGNIDTSEWVEYEIENLFSVETGTSISNNIGALDSGGTPVISATKYANGVYGYYCVEPEYENIITISRNGECGSTYYHDYKFAKTEDVFVLKDKKDIPNGAKPFIAAVYNKYFSFRSYNYKNKCTLDEVRSEKVKLPSKNDEPDWKYMKNYMRDTMEDARAKLDKLIKLTSC